MNTRQDLDPWVRLGNDLGDRCSKAIAKLLTIGFMAGIMFVTVIAAIAIYVWRIVIIKQ